MEILPRKVAPRLRWRTGAIGCLLPLMPFLALFFGLVAVRPSLLHDMAQGGQRGDAWLRMAEGMDWHGVNVPLAALSLYLLLETGRYGWRWADEEAARITPIALVPHASLFMRAIPWAEIADVRFVQRLQGRATVPCLEFALRNGGRLLIRGVDNEDGAAERFAAAAMARVEKAESAPG